MNEHEKDHEDKDEDYRNDKDEEKKGKKAGKMMPHLYCPAQAAAGMPMAPGMAMPQEALMPPAMPMYGQPFMCPMMQAMQMQPMMCPVMMQYFQMHPMMGVPYGDYNMMDEEE